MRYWARTDSYSRKNSQARTATLAALALLFLSPGAQAGKLRRAQAKTQYIKAVKMRSALEGEPQSDRTLAEYKQVVAAFHKIYFITTQTPEVAPSLLAQAELYQEMGRAFDPKYFRNAIDAYSFLLKQYPENRYRADALFTIAQIQKDELNQLDDAEAAYKDFLKKYSRSPKAEDARQALAEIAEARREESAPDTSRALAEKREGEKRLPRVVDIRTWNADTYTRVVVDLEDNVQYQSARIASPNRIYFDLYKAKLSPALAGKTIEVDNGFLKAVRVAQNKEGIVRLVLDLDSVKEYSAFLLQNPYRLVIDVHGQPIQEAKQTPPPPAPAVSAPASEPPAEMPAEPAPQQSAQDAANIPAPKDNLPLTAARARHRDLGPPPPPSEAKPAHNGQRSLTRTLGLKISRIVIDPGHGGQDTGTIGPRGLTEKDLCLDVALRLGKLIQERLPGADVVFTRKDDTFVPLEERTAIANQAKADLFISIHANSSHDRSARGVETYYLNFASSQDALEVAARENALSQSSIHDLQDMIKKIARQEKIEESKELADDVQTSLTHRLQQVSHAERDRGVKRAPFVVLIGANMPSVLAEISFISNPSDEKLLRKAEQRQRIAEGLYRGVTSYLESLNSLSYNQQKTTAAREDR